MALTDNLVSYYKMQGNANDELGTNNGSTVGTITFSDANGIIGNGAGMSGASPLANYINLGTGSTLLPTAITINGWGKYAAPVELQGMFFGRYRSTGDKLIFIMAERSTNKVTWIASASTDKVVTGTTVLTAGNWYMFTLTYDSTNGLKTYINASSDGTDTANGDLNTGAIVGAYLGGDPSGTNNGRPWKSAIDEVGIWSRALSGAEITSLYNSGAGLTYPFSSTSIKTWNGLADASTKTYNGLARGSVKTWNGLA